MTIKITFKSQDFDTKSGTSKRGQAYSIREQTGFAQLGEETRKVTIGLGREQLVYAVGVYVVDDSSFTTDQYGQLVVGRLVLKPVGAASAVPSAQRQSV
jgi:hypothetical protein